AFLAAVLIALFEKESPKFRRSAAAAVLGIVILTGIFVGIRDTSFVKENTALNRLATISLDEGKSRFMIWNMAWEGFKERPILGWGQENFNYVFNTYYDPRMYTQEQWFDRAHNVFFDWLIAGGVLGLGAHLFLIGAIVYYIFRTKGEFGGIRGKSILVGLLAGYFFHNFFVFDNVVSLILFYSLAAYVYAGHARTLLARKTGRALSSKSGAEYAVMSVAVLGLLLCLYFLNARPLQANASLIKAIQPQEKGLSENLAYMERATGKGYLGRQEAREQLVQFAGRFAGLENDPEMRNRIFDFARGEMLMQIDENPDDARFEVFLGSMLAYYQKYDEAAAHLERARELSPRKQSILFELGVAYLNMGDTEKTREILREAFELEPDFAEARIIYAAISIYAGDEKTAERILEEGFGTTAVADDRLLNAYAQTGNIVRVAEIWKAKIAADSKNHQNHVGLAASYLELGERSKAIEELEIAISLNPDFVAQGNALIQEIKAGRNPQ
ncbi:O-antigen ligase family protein, partial [bacterium]|nr:O-antigen ligase family protein [bacterium]